MIIEIAGPPGAGKSTVLPSVISACARAGLNGISMVDAARPLARRTVLGRFISTITPSRVEAVMLWRVHLVQRWFAALRFALANQRLVRHVLTSQRNRPSVSDRRQRKVLHWFFRAMGSYRLASDLAEDDEMIVIDEGFVHRAVQLFTSSMERPASEEVAAYLRLVPKPDLLVFVEAPLDLCVKRVISRGVWDRVSHRSDGEITDFVGNAHAALTQARAILTDRGWPMVVIHNDGDDPGSMQQSAEMVISSALGVTA